MSTLLNERAHVELPFIAQLTSMGWQHVEGDVDVPYLTERESFRDVLLRGRLREALRRINLDGRGEPWLDERRIDEAASVLERLGVHRLMEANQGATELLLKGTSVEGDPALHGGKDQTVRFLDFDHPERNDFIAINQFRVDVPGGQTYIVPDVVLFVNGIPLVVVECKSPAATNPMEEGITQLLRYSNQRDWVEEDEGVERLFHYNQVLVSTTRQEARVGTVGASHEHYLEWKDTSPVPISRVAAELGVERLNSQQILVAGMLRPAHLLDLVRHFTLFQQSGGKTIKIVARYQQLRAVQEAIRRLRTGKTRRQHGESDQRGGIIWHTQGSGKSLTMVFLVRAMRALPDLKRFKVVVVTDRTDLEKQLEETAALTGETVYKAKSVEKLKTLLRQDGSDLVFGMIQKYQQRDEDAEVIEITARRVSATAELWVADQRKENHTPAGGAGDWGPGAGGPTSDLQPPTPNTRYPTANPRRLVIRADDFPVLNESEEILVLVDEAHRSQASALHANLLRALPNCARIGFTGTPIIMGKGRRTHEIFGAYLDRYTIQQSQDDGATLRILYEGRTAEGEVTEGGSLDQLFADMFRGRTPEELEAIKARYATTGDVLEAPGLIRAKAADMLRHYVTAVLPNGLKAQVVATSRLAAIRYLDAFKSAHADLLRQLATLDPSLLGLPDEELSALDPETQLLVRAKPHEETVRRLEFAVVISGRHNDEPVYHQWSDKTKQEARIERFKRPLVHADPTKQGGLALLIVKSMLLTGFDAPVEQVLYLDRFMKEHELLQAIARVNRTHGNKSCGLVVDYYGVARHLHEALAVYGDEDVQGALVSLRDELPRLADRHRRALLVFLDRGIAEIADVDACVELLRDVKIRAQFVVALKLFLQSLDIVLPRPEALPYVRDAKILGFINKVAANLYRDGQMNLLGCGAKVRRLIDEHIRARGIDPKIPPISILDADFEEAVDAHRSARARASEMEHAARYHIRTHYNEDPAHYKKLSQRLEEILTALENNWDELVQALRDFTQEVREGRTADESGLDPRTHAPFLGILQEQVAPGAEPKQETLRRLVGQTVEIVEHIRQEIRVVDFWRNAHAQNVLRGWLVRYFDDHDTVPFERQQAAADRCVELAKTLHTRLVS